jgi:putative copper export protein
MHWLHTIISLIHVLAAAAWFGAMLYSLIVLHPRARSFFSHPRQFEDFITHIAAGARWKVLSGMGIIALTGIALLFLTTVKNGNSLAWHSCVYTKGILFVLAAGLFMHISWKAWPARVLASSDELPKYQRKFRLWGIVLLTLVGICMVLGIWSVNLR